MRELQDVADAWEKAVGEGKESLLATVVNVSGSTYRRPGARMLLTEEGWQTGSVSGGCLEGDILQKAWWRTREGQTALVTYDSTEEDDDVAWGFGLGCNGVVQVLLERLAPGPQNPVELIRSCLRLRQPGGIATVFAVEGKGPASVGSRLMLRPDGGLSSFLGDADLSERVGPDLREAVSRRISTTKTYSLPAGAVQVFLEAILPPIPLLIAGTGHDAVPLVRFAKELGWQVTVVETRSAWAKPERFPGADAVVACASNTLSEHLRLDERTAAVVMSHNYPNDKECLRVLLPSPVRYIGVLGPRRRTERMLEELRQEGLIPTAEQKARLHGPVGLDIGADHPEEIALAIVAEIQAVCAGRAGRPLRDRHAPHVSGPGKADITGA